MSYVYEANFERDEDGFVVTFPQFPEGVTFGKDINEAASNAAECLQLLIMDCLDGGKALPAPEFSDPPKTVVCVDVSEEDIARSKCMTVSEAAEELGVSRGRVSQLLSSGGLESFMYGTVRMVTVASVEERLANPPVPHRPKRD